MKPMKSEAETKIRKAVRDEIQRLDEYEERPVVEFAGVEPASGENVQLVFRKTGSSGDLDQGSPRQLVSDLEAEGISFIDFAQRSSGGGAIYVRTQGRLSPSKLASLMNTQFRA